MLAASACAFRISAAQSTGVCDDATETSSSPAAARSSVEMTSRAGGVGLLGVGVRCSANRRSSRARSR